MARKTWRVLGMVLLGVALAPAATALESGTDIVVPAAARGAGVGGSLWVTSLYILNPGSQQVDVTIGWLVRGSDNPNPEEVTRSVGAGELLVLDDAVMDLFGYDSGGGAFRVRAASPVVVNAGIFNRAGGKEFGQGFEGIPVGRAITAGNTTEAIGVSSGGDYRTNFFVVDTSGTGSQVTVTLVAHDGTIEGSRSYTLGAWEPILKNITDVASEAVEGGMVRFSVDSGSALVGASRVNGLSGDPLTLAAWSAAASGGGAAPTSLAGLTFDLTVSASESSGLAVDQESATVTMTGDLSATVEWAGSTFQASFETYTASGSMGFLGGSIPEWNITNLHVVMVWNDATHGSFYGGATDYDATGINIWGTFSLQ